MPQGLNISTSEHWDRLYELLRQDQLNWAQQAVVRAGFIPADLIHEVIPSDDGTEELKD